MKKIIPARRHYRPHPALLTELPFVVSPRHNYKHSRQSRGSLWQVPPIDDYELACVIGREYAAHFAQFLKDNPYTAGSNLLGRIASEVNFNDQSSARGYWIGFFSYLEQMVFAQATQSNVFADLDQFNARAVG